jgi:hypothetical protein
MIKENLRFLIGFFSITAFLICYSNNWPLTAFLVSLPFVVITLEVQGNRDFRKQQQQKQQRERKEQIEKQTNTTTKQPFLYTYSNEK